MQHFVMRSLYPPTIHFYLSLTSCFWYYSLESLLWGVLPSHNVHQRSTSWTSSTSSTSSCLSPLIVVAYSRPSIFLVLTLFNSVFCFFFNPLFYSSLYLASLKTKQNKMSKPASCTLVFQTSGSPHQVLWVIELIGLKKLEVWGRNVEPSNNSFQKLLTAHFSFFIFKI